jgi:MFS family permease
MSFVGQMGGSMINPAFILLADELGVTVTKASYLTTVNVLFGGVTPMFIVPYANVYGRRNLYVVRCPSVLKRKFFLLIASVSNIGSAVATSWGGVFIGRLFTGVGSSIPLGLGAATVSNSSSLPPLVFLTSIRP